MGAPNVLIHLVWANYRRRLIWSWTLSPRSQAVRDRRFFVFQRCYSETLTCRENRNNSIQQHPTSKVPCLMHIYHGSYVFFSIFWRAGIGWAWDLRKLSQVWPSKTWTWTSASWEVADFEGRHVLFGWNLERFWKNISICLLYVFICFFFLFFLFVQFVNIEMIGIMWLKWLILCDSIGPKVAYSLIRLWSEDGKKSLGIQYVFFCQSQSTNIGKQIWKFMWKTGWKQNDLSMSEQPRSTRPFLYTVSDVVLTTYMRKGKGCLYHLFADKNPTILMITIASMQGMVLSF